MKEMVSHSEGSIDAMLVIGRVDFATQFGLLYERGRRDGATEIHWGRIGGRSGKLMQRAAWVVHRLARLRRLANGDVRKLEYASRL